jgi:hypothetical protein
MGPTTSNERAGHRLACVKLLHPGLRHAVVNHRLHRQGVAFDMRLSDATMSRLAAPSRKLPQGLAERSLNIIMESSEDRTRRTPASEAAKSLAQR